jgi:membrane-associated protein
MDFLQHLYQTLRHLNPDSVRDFAQYVGPWLYVVLFAIVFCETGLVVWPFLPGDSLLFTVGAVAATGGISFPLAAVLMCLAANCGDLINYTIGYRLGPKVFSSESSRLLNKKHLQEAHAFYERYGKKTIIIARFVPIIRTFAPFVAGIGRMHFLTFALFSVTGGVFWVLTCLTAGYLLGQVDFVKKHFEVIVIAIVVISVIPAAVEFIKARRSRARGFEVTADAGSGEER